MERQMSPAESMPRRAHHLRKPLLWVGTLLLGVGVGHGIVAAINQFWQPDVPPTAEASPDFDLTPFGSEQPVRISDFHGQGIVLNFWASWCRPCREEMPALQSAWLHYRDQGVVFLGVNVWDEEGDALEFLREVGVTYPNGADSDSSVANLFRVQGLPTTLFIAPNGARSQTVYGPLTSRSLAKAVAAITP
jgi:thiol-disulfide isomerase/thioredoxin